MILLTKRTANVRAKGFCELCGLTRDVYNNIVAVYIEDKKAMEDYIMSKYGNSENVQEQYKEEQEKIAAAQFGMDEDGRCRGRGSGGSGTSAGRELSCRRGGGGLRGRTSRTWGASVLECRRNQPWLVLI